MQIDIRIEHVYGRPLYYPVNDLAKQFAQLCNVKTFTVTQLRIIHRMKVAINVLDTSIRGRELVRDILIERRT